MMASLIPCFSWEIVYSLLFFMYCWELWTSYARMMFDLLVSAMISQIKLDLTCIVCKTLFLSYTQPLTQQKLGNMDGCAVGQQSGNVNSSAPCKDPVQSQQSYWDEKLTCSNCKGLFVRRNGYCNRRKLSDFSRAFLCEPWYPLVETVHSD